MRLTSPAFNDGDPIPRGYAEDGLNPLPPLEIEDVPAQAATLAVVIEDPDSPLGKDVTHWLAWNLPAHTRHLDARHLPADLRVGTDTFGKVGYTGPNPPEGRHHYRFRVLALDRKLDLAEGATRTDFDRAVADHVLDDAELTGVFEHHMDGGEGG